MSFLGLLVGGFLGFLIVWVMSVFMEPNAINGLIALGFIVGMPFLGYHAGDYLSDSIHVANNRRQEAKRREAEARQRLLGNISSNRSSCVSAVSQSIELIERLPECLFKANIHLDAAEKEFKDNAYAPFWDEVEAAAFQMGEYNSSIRKVKANRDSYILKMRELERTSNVSGIPGFDIDISNVPSPQAVADRFTTLTRKGQTDFQFANIYEHRISRQVIIAGFRTLGEAICNLSSQIEYGFEDLRTTFEKEQYRTRRSIESLEDNVAAVHRGVNSLESDIDRLRRETR